MPRMCLLPAVIGLLCATPQPANADPIVLVFNRSTTAGVQMLGLINEDVARNADDLVATASLSRGSSAGVAQSTFESQLGADNQHLSGSGLAKAQATAPSVGGAAASSSGEAFMRFSLDQPHAFSFAGSFATGVEGYSVFEASVRTFPLFNLVFDFRRERAGWALDDDVEGEVHAAGVLLPGQYQFLVRGSTTVSCGSGVGALGCDLAEASISTRFDLALSAQPEEAVVPEPATMVLLGSGLAGLFAARRRSRPTDPRSF